MFQWFFDQGWFTSLLNPITLSLLQYRPVSVLLPVDLFANKQGNRFDFLKKIHPIVPSVCHRRLSCWCWVCFWLWRVWSWAAPALTQAMGQKANYNPVAPRDMPVLWLMHGIVCMDLGKSWLTTRPFSPLPPAAAGLGRVDVRMASLIDCCGIKQKPFLGRTGGSPPVLSNVGEIII